MTNTNNSSSMTTLFTSHCQWLSITVIHYRLLFWSVKWLAVTCN